MQIDKNIELFLKNLKNEFLTTFQQMSQTLNQELESTDFDPDLCFVNLVNIITNCVQNVFPVSKVSNKHQKRFRKPWMTQGILNSSDEKHKL